MKIHDWKDVIEHFLENGSNDYLWNYITALRSGDDVHDMWKFMVTCIIRGEGLNGMAWDISWTKDCLRNYEDEYIQHKLSNNFKRIPSHCVGHNQRGLESLSVYYKNVIKNEDVANLLNTLSTKLFLEREQIPKIVRKIINLLYEDK